MNHGREKTHTWKNYAYWEVKIIAGICTDVDELSACLKLMENDLGFMSQLGFHGAHSDE